MQKPARFLALSVTLIMLIAGCSGRMESRGPDDTIQLRLTHEESETDVQGQYAVRFKELVEQRTDGRVQVDIYSAGQLGTDEDNLKMLEDGAIEAAVSTPSITGSIINENQALSVPFVFSDDMSVNREVLRTSTALNDDLSSVYRERGLEVLSFWTEGYMAWSSNQPINDPEGMGGLRIRTMTSPMLIKAYEVLGANPTPMDAGETYTALQTNMIDATENPLFFIYSGNTHEVQDYLTLSRHHIYVTSTILNAGFLEDLPDDIRGVVEDTVDELDGWSFDLQSEMNEDALAGMRESSIEIVELTDAERETFRDMSLPAREQYGETFGSDADRILSTLIEDVERAEDSRN